MKITTRNTKTGVTMSFKATSRKDGQALTRFVFGMADQDLCEFCGRGIPFTAFDAHVKSCREKSTGPKV